MSGEGNSLPLTWIETFLGRVINYGSTEKAEPDAITNDTWVLELEDIEKDTSKVLARLTFAERKSKSTKNRFEAGDVLYGKLRPYLNKIVIADRPGVCTTEILPLKPNEVINGPYLFYWLKHPRFLDYVKAVSYGVNMPRLGTESGNNAPFVLAPLPEQKRIADKLDTVLARVDVCRERLNRVPLILKRFRQSVLAAATSGQLTTDWREQNVGLVEEQNPTIADEHWASLAQSHFLTSDLPEGWAWNSLAIGITEMNYGTSSKSSKTGATPVLRMGNLQNGKLDWSDLVYSNDEKENLKYSLTDGDILFNRTNSPELVGKTSIYSGERPAIFAGYLIRVRCKVDVLLPKYVNFCLNSPYGKAYCWAVKSDGVSQSNINAEKLRNLPIPYCVLKEQHEIVRRVETLFAFADRLEARLATARAATDRLTPALLAKAFRGELVPQDPNDEPAAELLKRLAAARIATSDKPRRGRVAKVEKRSSDHPSQVCDS